MIEYIDYFTEEPGEEKRYCKACGSLCNVERNLPGGTIMSYALRTGATKHDRFICRYVKEEWHIQASRLFRDICDCNSPTLKQIMQKDLNEIIKQNLPDV